MGMLDKTNSRATRRSVTGWVIGGGIVGFGIGWLQSIGMDMSQTGRFVLVPLMTFAGALVGGLIEWQDG